MKTHRIHSAWQRLLLALATACAVQAAALAAPSTSTIKLNIETGQEALLAGTPQTTYIRIGLSGIRPPSGDKRPPLNVALVLDRSGSMQGEKLTHAKEAALLALDHLRSDDILSVVTYDHTVDVLLPATRLSDKEAVRRKLREIDAGGNTALFAGVSKGAGELRKFLEKERVNRMVLLSDGLANVGPSTPAELERLGIELGGERISVSTIGLGLGYNEDLMVRLAAASDGNHVFAERAAELGEVFRREFGDIGSVVAQGVTIIIQCREGVRPVRVLGRDAQVSGSQVTARINQVTAQQEKYLLLEVEVAPQAELAARDLASVEVRYDDLAARQSDRLEGKATIRITGSANEAAGSVNRGVMVSASSQLAAELDDRAVEAKDKGDTAGAQAIFRQKSEMLERDADRYQSIELKAQSESARSAEAAAAAPAADWNRARKAVREEQNVIRSQQSYQ